MKLTTECVNRMTTLIDHLTERSDFSIEEAISDCFGIHAESVAETLSEVLTTIDLSYFGSKEHMGKMFTQGCSGDSWYRMLSNETLTNYLSHHDSPVAEALYRIKSTLAVTHFENEIVVTFSTAYGPGRENACIKAEHWNDWVKGIPESVPSDIRAYFQNFDQKLIESAIVALRARQ